MHSRRLGAFLVGAWLIGGVLMAFVTAQSDASVGRFFNNPPPEIVPVLEKTDPGTIRSILRFQSAQHARDMVESWEVMQLGLAGSLLASAFLTPHRSRIVLMCALLMGLIVLVMHFGVTPTMHSLARSADPSLESAAPEHRDRHTTYTVWYRVLEIFKLGLGGVVAARLLFDRHEWKQTLAPVTVKPHRSERTR